MVYRKMGFKIASIYMYYCRKVLIANIYYLQIASLQAIDSQANVCIYHNTVQGWHLQLLDSQFGLTFLEHSH